VIEIRDLSGGDSSLDGTEVSWSLSFTCICTAWLFVAQTQVLDRTEVLQDLSCAELKFKLEPGYEGAAVDAPLDRRNLSSAGTRVPNAVEPPKT
jgi:hypothetical protein